MLLDAAKFGFGAGGALFEPDEAEHVLVGIAGVDPLEVLEQDGDGR